jgi:hypothetical protein
VGLQYDILLKNGKVVDPLNKIEDCYDVGITGGQISAVSQDLPASEAREIFDLHGACVLPGIIDLHVHVSPWLGGRFGYKMMAQVGVTTALDMAGPMDGLLGYAKKYGSGLNIACIEYVRPGHTVKDTDPSSKEIRDLLNLSLSKGSLGLKLLGGHYPLTPDATKRAIEIVNEQKAYVALHAGTMEKGSNIEGFHQGVEAAQGLALHMCHISAYCRGYTRPYMIETEEAVAALKANPNIRSESHLAAINACPAKCSNGQPESLITRKGLSVGGFSETEKGMEAAILHGWALINIEAGGTTMLATGKDAYTYWRAKETNTTVSFPVYPREPRIRLTTALNDSGNFVVDCISTDGGGIPRNVIVEMGIPLVKLQALTLSEFVIKTSLNPARILGLHNKGHLSVGADADITIVDVASERATLAIASGKIIMHQGYVCGQGCKIITTQEGKAYVKEQGIEPIVVDLATSAFYDKKALAKP